MYDAKNEKKPITSTKKTIASIRLLFRYRIFPPSFIRILTSNLIDTQFCQGDKHRKTEEITSTTEDTEITE